MKKKFFLTLAMILCFIVACTILVACNEDRSTENFTNGSEFPSADRPGEEISGGDYPSEMPEDTPEEETPVVYCTVSFNTIGGSEIESIKVEKGNRINISADPIKEGHLFVGWYKDVDYTEPMDFTTYVVNEDITLFAKYIPTITSPADLKSMALDGTYYLTANIDLGGAEWVPVGSKESPFTGIFEGNGHTISNFKITIGRKYIGLFGVNAGSINNLKIEGYTIEVGCDDDIYVGGLIAYNEGGAITNCCTTTDITVTVSGNATVGGLVGFNNLEGAIQHCYTLGQVSATATSSAHIGGLVGCNNKGIVANCYTTGATNLSTGYSAFGGSLVGYNRDSIINCYATGNIIASSARKAYASGLVGNNSTQGTITNCYATGDVSVTAYDSYTDASGGGLVGYNEGDVTKSYATGNVNAYAADDNACAGGLVGHNSWGSNVANCYATGSVNATSPEEYAYAGGLVGSNAHYYISISNCYATGNATANACRGAHAGGLVGCNGSISNCYATGDATASASYFSFAAGLVGMTDGLAIANSFATGNVSSTSPTPKAGGLVIYYDGDNTSTNCYCYSGQRFMVRKNGVTTNIATNTIGVIKSLATLTSSAFLTDTLGWLADNWAFVSGECPTLKDVGTISTYTSLV